jgi:predicted NAD/FAD-binding protein
MNMLKFAVIGSGITGLGAAWLLNRYSLDVTVFEADNRIGGHANTVTGYNHPAVDTGFIVFNEWTYPNLQELFRILEVPIRKTDMSFGVSARQGTFEYSSDAIFAQKKLLFQPSYYRMLYDLARFYKSVPKEYHQFNEKLTLHEYLKNKNYSKIFIEDHLIPMGAAIWSVNADSMLDFPMKSFAQFCMNHGLLNLVERPQWYTVEGGSRTYVDAISHNFRDKIIHNKAVTSIHRDKGYVYVNGEQFDKAIICTHPDQALNMLDDTDESENDILSAITYSENKAILHRDASQMPHNKKTWAAWNYLKSDDDSKVTLTYWMNRLQTFLPENDNLFVTLNPEKPIAEDLILSKHVYHHPIYNFKAIEAQSRIKDIQGKRNTWFAGAWCGYGFHEDGLTAGLTVAEIAGSIKRPWQVKEKSSAYENLV